MSQKNTLNTFGRGGGSPSLGKTNQVRRNGPGKFRARGGSSRFGEWQGGAAQKDNAAKIGAREFGTLFDFERTGCYPNFAPRTS
jgi:hypothetical protein